MCETTVYLLREGREEEIMRDVMLLQPEEMPSYWSICSENRNWCEAISRRLTF